VPGWSWQHGDEDESYEHFVKIAGLYGLNPEDFKTAEPAPTPDSAAQAVEQTREVDDVDEPDGDAGQTSAPPTPAAPADENLPPEFVDIKAKELARRARKQGKKVSAPADGDHKASTATAAEETTGAAA
jgi:hypothetical protein